MRVVTYLEQNEQVCQTLFRFGIRLSDVRYLDMYHEYMRMTKDGIKATFIIPYLSEQYDVSESTLRRILQRLQQRISFKE